MRFIPGDGAEIAVRVTMPLVVAAGKNRLDRFDICDAPL